jgi:hypothetical protein
VDADVVIAWAHSGFPEAAKAAFKRPTRFIVLPNPTSWKTPLAGYESPSPVRAIVSKFAPGVTPTRIATLGFSASCQGVASLLASKDGGRLDAAVAIDGIHTGRPVTAAAMTPWLNFAKFAFLNERLFVITHSAVKPTYASTTETADWLWKTLTGSLAPFQDPPVPPIPIAPTSVHVGAGPATGPDRTVDYPTPPAKPARRRGGMVILGFENRDIPMGTADHIYQAKAVMPAVLSALLAARWNAIDPSSPDSACYVG